MILAGGFSGFHTHGAGVPAGQEPTDMLCPLGKNCTDRPNSPYAAIPKIRRPISSRTETVTENRQATITGKIAAARGGKGSRNISAPHAGAPEAGTGIYGPHSAKKQTADSPPEPAAEPAEPCFR